MVGCGPNSNKNILGNVYVNSILQEDSTYLGVSAIRIDTLIEDTLYIKYRMYGDKFINDQYCKTKEGAYNSLNRTSIGFFDTAQTRSLMLKENTLILYERDTDTKSQVFMYSYKDDVLFSEYQNIYFAEDGFGLFKSIKKSRE